MSNKQWASIGDWIAYLEKVIDDAAKHATKNEVQISKLRDRVKKLETVKR